MLLLPQGKKKDCLTAFFEFFRSSGWRLDRTHIGGCS